MRTYMGLHNHTHYSNLRLLDCINKPRDLVDTAIQLGLSGICVTDHECLSSHVEFVKIAKELKEAGSDFRIGLGNEIYLTDTRERNQIYYHFILIAKDSLGHKMLRELSSTAWFNSYVDRGMERVPTLKSELKEVIEKYGRGHLIATTACIGGEASSNLLKFSQTKDIVYIQKAEKFVLFCKQLFGDDFYIECAPSLYSDQITVNKLLSKLANNFHLKMVIGTDAHYLTADQRQIHKLYLNSKPGEREVDDFYEFAHLMDSDEVFDLLSKSFSEDFINEILDNTLEVQNKIESYDLFHKQDIPKVPVKDYPKRDIPDMDNYPNLNRLFHSDDIQDRYWVNECFNGLHKIDKCNKTYLTELEEEARVKTVIGNKLDTNMFRYPNTLQHYIDLIWECGSIVGAGRGSSCAALNHYLMGITQLDPIQWKLPFFRYMNDERTELGCLILILPSCK